MKLFSILTRYRWILMTAGVLKWMSFHVWVLHEKFGVEYHASIWDSIVSNILLTGIAITLINVVLRYVPSFGKFWFAIGLSFFLSLGWLWLTGEALSGIASEDAAYSQFLMNAQPVRWAIGFLFIAGASIGGIFYNQTMDLQADQKRESDSKAMLKEAELQKLQLQLQPHFLFNSLNSINALIHSKPDKAQQMVQQLSDFLRVTTRRADEHWIRFADEWEYVQLYLSIERVRFGHRLEIATDINGRVDDWTIPTLVLQPLIENAIKFGLYGTTEHVKIDFEVKASETMLTIRISNPFDPDSAPQSGSGFGLTGLKRRLYLLYAQNDLLETRKNENIYIVELNLPKK